MYFDMTSWNCCSVGVTSTSIPPRCFSTSSMNGACGIEELGDVDDDDDIVCGMYDRNGKRFGQRLSEGLMQCASRSYANTTLSHSDPKPSSNVRVEHSTYHLHFSTQSQHLVWSKPMVIENTVRHIPRSLLLLLRTQLPRSLLDNHLVTSLRTRLPRPAFCFVSINTHWVLVTLTLTSTTTMRMIYSIHSHTTHFRSSTQPPTSTRFTQSTMLVVDVRHSANRCNALRRYKAYFAGL